MAYTFKKYGDSEDTKKKYQAYQDHKSTKPGEHTFAKQQDLDAARDAWMNRGPFQYNMADDGMYQQMVDRYVQQGNMAMQDTIGQSAALTGGYGNTWAQTAGQQAYQGYLQGLNDMTPELYGMALDRYQMEGENLYNQYAALSAEAEQAYDHHMDDLNLWQQESNALKADAEASRNFDWEQYVTGEQMAYQKEQDRLTQENWEKSFNYQKEQDKLTQENWERSFNYQKEQDSISNYYAQLAAQPQVEYAAFSNEDYNSWDSKMAGATKLKDLENIAEVMEAMNIDPNIVDAMYKKYSYKFHPAPDVVRVGGPRPYAP